MNPFSLKQWFFASLLCTSAHAANPLPLSPAYWSDPAFQKAFNGSYRIEARIEPSVSTEERGLLVEVQNLMAKSQRKQALAKLAENKLTKQSPALQFNLANLHFEEGELKEATSLYQAAVKEFPSFRRAHRNLGMVLLRQDELEPALTHLTEAIRLGDAEGATYGMLAYCRLQREEWASALQAYRLAQVTEPEVVDWKAGVAQCLQHLNAREEAVALLDEVIRQRPSEFSYALLQAGMYLDLDQPENAVKALELPRRLGTLDADGLLLLADLHLRQGRPQPAQQVINEAFSREQAPALERIISISENAINLENWELSKDLLNRATKSLTAIPRALRLTQARYAIESLADPQQGETVLRQLIEEDPSDVRALFTLGKYLAASGQPSEAELILERATTQKDQTAIDAWIELARLQVEERHYPTALQSIDQALALQESSSLRAYRTSLQRLIEAAE